MADDRAFRMKGLFQGCLIGEGHAFDIEMNRLFDCLSVRHILIPFSEMALDSFARPEGKPGRLWTTGLSLSVSVWVQMFVMASEASE
jgi:hypothetical protein